MKTTVVISLSVTLLLAAVAAAQVYPIRWDDDDPVAVSTQEVASGGAVSAETLRLRPRDTAPFACTLDLLGYLYVQNDVCDVLTTADTVLCICASIEGDPHWNGIGFQGFCQALELGYSC